MVPPQVSSVARKPLSIGFEEIAADKIVRTSGCRRRGRARRRRQPHVATTDEAVRRDGLITR
jgi:hypothetical protein